MMTSVERVENMRVDAAMMSGLGEAYGDRMWGLVCLRALAKA